MFARALAIVSGLLLLSGCATYHPQPLAPQDTAHAFLTRSLRDQGLRRYIERATGTAPPVAWDFPALMLAASYYHPDIRLAQAQWRTAQARLVAAGARPNPSATTSAQHDVDAVGISPWTLALDLNFTLETDGKRGDRIDNARARVDAAQRRVAAATWRVASRLRRRLLALYQAQQSGAILRRLEQVQAKYVALLERRLAAGNLSSFELAQIRLALDGTRLRIRASEKQAAVARARVADAVAIPADALSGVDLALTMFDHPALGASLPGLDLRTHALQRRADILAALDDYAAAEAALKLEVARQYPDLQLGPGFTWDQGQRKWSLALGFPLPFSRNRGPIAIARAQRSEAAARFVALQAKVAGDLAAAQTEYALALKQLDTADALLAANEGRLRALRGRLRPGVLSTSAELNAEITQTQATLSHLDALTQAQQAFGRLEDAVQQPLDPLELPSLLRPNSKGESP